MRKQLFNVIEPNTNHNIKSRLYDYLMIAAIFAGLLPLAFRHHSPWMMVLDKVSCALFIMDYIFRWICADFDSKHGKWGFLLYPLRPMAIIDMLSILPSVIVINSVYKVFRVARLLKILRLARVVRYYVPLQVMISVVKKEFATLMTVFIFAVFYILLTALIMFNVEEGSNYATGEPVFRTFFEAVYWSACTLTTVGYGDICPISNIGRFVCILSSLVGVAIIALPSGVITAGYLNEIREMKAHKKMLKDQNQQELETSYETI